MESTSSAWHSSPKPFQDRQQEMVDGFGEQTTVKRQRSLVRRNSSTRNGPSRKLVGANANSAFRRGPNAVPVVHSSQQENDLNIEKMRQEESEQSLELQAKERSLWVSVSKVFTWYAPTWLLTKWGKTNANVQQAWREKMTLVTIIFFMCLMLAFITFALQAIICPPADNKRAPFNQPPGGSQYRLDGEFYAASAVPNAPTGLQPNTDITASFALIDQKNGKTPDCDALNYIPTQTDCKIQSSSTSASCASNAAGSSLNVLVTYDWNDLQTLSNFIVFDGYVLDLNNFASQMKPSSPLNNDDHQGGPIFDTILQRAFNSNAKDVTRSLTASASLTQRAYCLVEKYK